MKHWLAASLGLLALAGCDQGRRDMNKGNDAGESATTASGGEVARQLEQAAEQSSPQASESLERAADAARGQESMAAPGQPGSYAQRAMEEAAKADASGAPKP